MDIMDLKEQIQRSHRYTDREDRTDLITTWTEEELHGGEVKDVFSVIFRTRGCSWSYESGCSMCGYYTATNPDITEDDLNDQLNDALERYTGEDIVKIYTSGSFLDTGEVSFELGLNILGSFDAQKILIESRPEYVEEGELERYEEKAEELEVAIGLESANDFVLEHCINKGFTFEDYREAAETIKNVGARSRTYLLFKPPFLTELEAMDDISDSIKKIEGLTDMISINPVNVQRGSLVDWLHKRKLYRPPWLWSLVEVLRKLDTDATVVSSKAGLGTRRGCHNCEDCNENIIEMIEEFNLTQDPDVFNPLKEKNICDCRETWKKEKELEPFLHFRGTPKILRDRYAGDI